MIDVVETTDYHTAGEPFRIVADSALSFDGATVADKRVRAQRSESLERIRTMLCREPRGHADMYGCFVVEPDDEGADFGALFWHNDGYSTACGHGTIALGAWAIQTGRVLAEPDGVRSVIIDVPSGRVEARVTQVGGATTAIAFANVPSYPVARSHDVHLARGQVTVDVAFAGALYACVAASSLGLRVTPDNVGDLRVLGREIKWALNDTTVAHHALDPRLGGIYGTIIYDDLGATPDGLHQRNVTVFADGRIDRSPCGSGTAARLALLAQDGRLAPGDVLIHESIIGTQFRAWYESVDDGQPQGAVTAIVEGMAHQTGRATFSLDPADPLGAGFILP